MKHVLFGEDKGAHGKGPEDVAQKVSEATCLYERRREWLEFEVMAPEEQTAALDHTFELSCSGGAYGWEEIEVTVDGKRDWCRASYVGTTVDEFRDKVRAMGELEDLWTGFSLEPGGYSWHVSRRFDLVYLSMELQSSVKTLYLRWQELLNVLDPHEAQSRAWWEEWWQNEWLKECWEDSYTNIVGYYWDEGLWEIDVKDDALNMWDNPDPHWWSYQPVRTPDHLELLRVPWTTDELSFAHKTMEDLEAEGIPQDWDWFAKDRGHGWEQLLVECAGQRYAYSDFGMDELVATVHALADGEDRVFRHGKIPGPHDWYFSRRGYFVQVGMAFFRGWCFIVTYDHLCAAFDEA